MRIKQSLTSFILRSQGILWALSRRTFILNFIQPLTAKLKEISGNLVGTLTEDLYSELYLKEKIARLIRATAAWY